MSDEQHYQTRSDYEESDDYDYVPIGFAPGETDERAVWSNPDVTPYPALINSPEKEHEWFCPNCGGECTIHLLDDPEESDEAMRGAIEDSGGSITCSECGEPMYAFRSLHPLRDVGV